MIGQTKFFTVAERENTIVNRLNKYELAKLSASNFIVQDARREAIRNREK